MQHVQSLKKKLRWYEKKRKRKNERKKREKKLGVGNECNISRKNKI